MIDEVSDTLCRDRKHAVKALNGRDAHDKHAKRRGSKPTYGPTEQAAHRRHLEALRAALLCPRHANPAALDRQLSSPPRGRR